MNLNKEESRISIPNGISLDRYIKMKEQDFPYATGELSQLLRDIALASKVINLEINKAGLINLSGKSGHRNIYGEYQSKLDILANIRFRNELVLGKEVCAIVSEEDDKVVHLNENGKYIIAIDPLDGSSNIDVNISIGSIFSIYRRFSKIGETPDKSDYLLSGNKQVAAGYILYGSSTMLVYTTGSGVNGFTYNSLLGEFYLSHPYMKMPEDGNIYSINEGYYHSFSKGIQEYIKTCKIKEYSGRYVGSLVADFHRNLLKGGIFLYPPTEKNPEGKLRLMFECNPLSFIAEQAGGRASNGYHRILGIQPKNIHQQTAFYVGSKNMVQDLEKHIGHASLTDRVNVKQDMI